MSEDDDPTDETGSGVGVQFRRDPLPADLDLADTAAVRRWIQAVAEQEIVMSGAPRPAIRIFCEDKLVTAPLAGLVEVGQEAILAAVWHALGQIEGARHRFRSGTVLLGPEGAARTAAVVMSWQHHLTEGLQPGDALPRGLPGFGARWWLTYRLYGAGGGGTGVLHGDWVEREGVNFEGLDEPFRELLDSEGLETNLPAHLDWKPKPGLDILTEWAMRAPGVPPPTTADEYLHQMTSLAFPEALNKGIDRLWAFPFHGDWLEFWRIGGHLPCGIDDVMRNVAKFSGAEAIGFVVVGAAQIPDGSTKRTLLAVVEYEGVRAMKQLVVDIREGKPVPIGEMTQDPMQIPPEARWVGVEPGHDMQIRTEWVRRVGIGGTPGEPLPEG